MPEKTRSRRAASARPARTWTMAPSLTELAQDRSQTNRPKKKTWTMAPSLEEVSEAVSRPRRSEESRPRRKARGVLATIGDAAGTILDNVIPNGADEVAGVGSGIGYLLTGRDFGEGFEAGQQRFEQQQEDFEEEHPYLQNLAAGTGFVGGMFLPAGRIAQGATRVDRARKAAGWGAGYAGLSGALDGDGFQERATNAAMAIPVGAGIGYVAPGLVDDAIQAAPAVAKTFRELMSDVSGEVRMPGGEPRPPVAATDFRNPDLGPVMSNSNWAILTGENPNGIGLSAAENAERNARLLREVRELGIEPVPVVGHYGGNPENSYMLSPITQEQALQLGGRFEQDSILTNRGLLYHDGTLTPSDGAQYFEEAPEDFFSVIDTPDGPANFAVNLQWGDDGDMVRIADDTRRPGDYPDPRGTALGSRQEPFGRGGANVYNDEGLQARLAELGMQPRAAAQPIVGTNGRPGDAYVNPSLISTRRPSEANYATQGNPDEELLLQTGQSLRDAPDALAKNMDILAREPFMQGATGTPDELYEQAVRRGADNMRYIAEELMPPELVESSRGWYNTANGFAGDMAGRFGITEDQASGVLAALSPQNHWANNVANAEQLLQLRQGGFDGTGLGPDAARLADRMANDGGRKKNAIALMGPDEARRIMETPFEELSRREQRHKVAMLAELQLDPTLYDIAPDGTRLGPMGRVSFGSSNEVGAALDILDGTEIGRVLAGGGKVPSFYNNIVDPDAPLPMVTTDTHHAGAFSLFPGGGDDTIVKLGMGRGAGSNSARTGSKGIYGLITDATALAGDEMGMLPREVQSVVWEGVRGLWGGPGVKTPALKRAVAEIWQTSATPEEARKRIGVLMGRQ